MSNRLSSILSHWVAGAETTEWVLATVYKTEGSAYRKAGAWGLFNGLGQRFGLLSGGCLEADIQQQARRVMQTGTARTICYDASDEDDLSFQLGVGCGGVVHILLQPIRSSDDLQLRAIQQSLAARQCGWFYQLIPDASGKVAARFEPVAALEKNARAGLRDIDGETWLVSPVRPEPHLLVAGAGSDAQPLVSMAKLLGWRVTLVDPRPANARAEHFPDADVILREFGAPLVAYLRESVAEAAMLMTHSVALDAEALATLQSVELDYLALLGPPHRRKEVLDLAGLTDATLRTPVHGPAGLDIGADLPESIALAILAEAHACLMERNAASLTRLAEQAVPAELSWPPSR